MSCFGSIFSYIYLYILSERLIIFYSIISFLWSSILLMTHSSIKIQKKRIHELVGFWTIFCL